MVNDTNPPDTNPPRTRDLTGLVPSDIARASDVSATDPFRPWLNMAMENHKTMNERMGDVVKLAKDRRECVRMAVSLGATHEQVAQELGVSRVTVTLMMKER